MQEEKERLRQEADQLAQRLQTVLKAKFAERVCFDAETPIDKTLGYLQSVISVRVPKHTLTTQPVLEGQAGGLGDIACIYCMCVYLCSSVHSARVFNESHLALYLGQETMHILHAVTSIRSLSNQHTLAMPCLLQTNPQLANPSYMQYVMLQHIYFALIPPPQQAGSYPCLMHSNN